MLNNYCHFLNAAAGFETNRAYIARAAPRYRRLTPKTINNGVNPMYDPKSAPDVIRFTRGCLACFMIIILAGCAGIAGKGRLSKFSEVVRSYEDALERSDYRKASKFVDPSAEGERVDYKKFANIKIVRHKVTNVQVSEDQKSIEQDVEIQYFLLDRNRLKTINDHQVWQYKEEGKVWLLQTGLPKLVH